jgi:chromosome segregation ATPase
LAAQAQLSTERSEADALNAEISKLRSQFADLRSKLTTCQNALDRFEEAFHSYSGMVGASNRGNYARSQSLYQRAVGQLEAARAEARECSPLFGLA